jgi:hypothetical protein
LIESYSYF